eukprot:2459202-Ditylum_brightwellii.AAC.1
MTISAKQPFTGKAADVSASNLTLCSNHSGDKEGEISASRTINDDKQDREGGMSVEEAQEGLFDCASVNDNVLVVSNHNTEVEPMKINPNTQQVKHKSVKFAQMDMFENDTNNLSDEEYEPRSEKQ